MADDSGQEKKHQPTEKRLEDASEKGQIVRSQELSSATVLICGAVALAYGFGPAAEALSELMQWCWSFGGPQSMDLGLATLLLDRSVKAAAIAVAVPLGSICVGVLAVGLAQTRFRLAPKALEPKPERLDPIAGAKQKFFSWTPLMELAKGVSKLAALAGVVAFGMRDRILELPAMAVLPADQQISTLVDLGFDLVLYSVPLMLVIAVADYAYNHWKLNDDLMMTDHELKEERKQQEGDPLMKAARRSRQRLVAMGMGLARVREADLVVTNPTHYAVALRYRKGEAPAPIILAMGVDHMALRIRREARQNDIIRIENRPLARALYAAGKVGEMIPEELFAPVAKVLAVVYKKRRQRG
ncbi:MAG TPA: EscU/YscU/HrcU family type III secretion system export apparatus switch protein [Myxococcota bacterium]|nr:EscU/YscU/HrcU family type III secretion system export apparatus switch protein [Myxococcota bacterium]